jgi:hypothetical protein
MSNKTPEEERIQKEEEERDKEKGERRLRKTATPSS